MSDISRRATSFGSIAPDYDRFRPGPSDAVAEWLLRSDVAVAADVCAGTGGFTKVVAGRAGRVLAFELDPRMLAVLRRNVPAALAVGSSGEALPVREGSIDAVTVSSAWHWLDSDRALVEMARVLRPGGVLGVVWSGPDRRVEWVAQLLGDGISTLPPSVRSGRSLTIDAGLPFASPEHTVLEWTLTKSRDDLLGLAGTYSRVITLAPEDRHRLEQGRAALLDDLGLTGPATVDLPMRALCWRTVRL